MRTFPISAENLYDWFPCAHVENPFAAETWWQVNALGTLAATQILRLVPAGPEQQQALVELRRAIDTCLLVIPTPPDEEIQRRMAQTLAPYCPTPFPTVAAMLDLAELTPDDVLIDLGSGDGRIVFEAAIRGALAIGIDVDALLVGQAEERKAEHPLYSRASFRHGDVLEADLSEATVVTCYLLSSSMDALVAKFRTLRPGTRIISHAFLMAGWPPDCTILVDGTPIHRWIV